MLADWHFCTIKRFLYCTVTRLFCRDSAFEAQGLGAKIASAGISQVSFAAVAAIHVDCLNYRFQPDSSHSEYIVSQPSLTGFW